MRPLSATPADPQYHAGIHPALTSFADECCATLARLTVYVGALALLGIVGHHLWDELPVTVPLEPAGKPGWSAASRSRPAFAVSSLELPEKSETYDILRHPKGGRKDIFHWGPQDEMPVAELEIYRRGGEFNPSAAFEAEIAARIDPEGAHEMEAAGVLDSKFGTVTLLRLTNNPGGAKSCLGFIKRLGDAALQISGWSCQGSGLPARRAAIGCMLNRLTLLSAGNEPKLAELFARAELKRGSCANAAAPAASADWVMSAEIPGCAAPCRLTHQPRCWFSSAFLARGGIILTQCGAIDLVKTCPAARMAGETDMAACPPHEDLMTPNLPAANKLAVLLAAIALVAIGFDATPARTQTQAPAGTQKQASTPKQTGAQKQARRQYDDRGRPYYGPNGPNVSYQQGPHTRIYVTKRSWLDAGVEVLPGDRKFTDYAFPPDIGYPSFARENNNRPIDRQPLNPPSDMGGYPLSIPY